jgi:NADPH:quinone reductase-like Zn-dependent oxidoreductase
VAYITAWAALVNAAQIQAGETTLIIGTTGAWEVPRLALRINSALE